LRISLEEYSSFVLIGHSLNPISDEEILVQLLLYLIITSGVRGIRILKLVSGR